MNCRRVRAALNHYYDRDLSVKRLAAIEEHLRGCEACQREYARLRETMSLLEGLSEVELPPRFTTNVLRALANEKIKQPARAQVSMGFLLIAVGATFSALIVAGIGGRGLFDLSATQVTLASVAASAAKLLGVVADVLPPLADVLVGELGGFAAWLLVADVVLLLAILAAGSRLLAVRSTRKTMSLLTL